MKFHTQVIIREKQPGEYDDEGVFSNIAEAVDHIQNVVVGNGDVSKAWINGVKVKIKSGYVYGDDDEPLCTNPEWYKIFSSGDFLKIWNEATAKAAGVI